MRHSELQVRLLGDFSVTRADGSVVLDGQWKTGKTMDLVRILALSDGRSVRLSRLTSVLWPDVSEQRARGSLRTAASQIRTAIGSNCVERRHDGLALTSAWVDVVEFLEGVTRVHGAHQRGDPHRVLELTRATDGLHTGRFHAHDDSASWVDAEREVIARARHAMLCEAAASALETGELDEAVALAERAVEVDSSSELANRLLMTAHAELGDIGRALRVFERFRGHLAAELGVDPSPQTRELHLRLLRGS